MRFPPPRLNRRSSRRWQTCETAGLRSAEVTPFLLRRIAKLTGDRSLRANLALLRNNARVAAAIAVALNSD